IALMLELVPGEVDGFSPQLLQHVVGFLPEGRHEIRHPLPTLAGDSQGALLGVRWRRFHETDKDLFACALQLVCDLVRNHPACTKATEKIGATGLSTADLLQVVTCHPLDGR